MKRLLTGLCALLFMAFALPAFAAGPHDMQCMECHSTHYAKGDYAIGVQPLTDVDNPARTRVGQKVADIDALCLGCHNEEEGIMPVDLRMSHPTGVKPTYTNVPKQLLKDGTFTCVSCHNPHPSNPNYKYLIVATEEGGEMGVFCAKCHPLQSDPETVQATGKLRILSDTPSAPIVRIEQNTEQ